MGSVCGTISRACLEACVALQEPLMFALVTSYFAMLAKCSGFGNSLGCVIKGTPAWNRPDGDDVEVHHGKASGGSWYSAGIIPDKSIRRKPGSHAPKWSFSSAQLSGCKKL